MDLFDLTTKELSFNETISLSKELGRKISKLYSPDIIIGINNGGFLPGKEISKEFDLYFETIHIGRNIDLKKFYEHFKFVKPLIQAYHGILFLTKKPCLLEKFEKNVENKKILIVDDTVHTGKTLKVAINYLKDFNPSQIKTTSLNYIRNSKPDFFLSKERLKFPWSKNSEEYKKYLNYRE